MTAPAEPSRGSGADFKPSRFSRAYKAIALGDPVLLVGMAALVVYYVATRGVFQGKYSGDGLFGFEYLRAVVYHHTIDMQKVLPEWLPYFALDPQTHHMPNRCPFGPVLVWLPFYLLACGLAELGRLMHLVALKPNSLFHAWMAGLGSLGLALVGYRQCYALFERHLGRDAARLGATAAVWATPIAWYAVTQPMYQHACAFGLVALLVERWDVWRSAATIERWAVLGLIGGLAMAMRAQEALFLLLPGIDAAVGVVRGRAPLGRAGWLKAGVALSVCTIISFFPQMWVWHFYTGSFLHPAQVEPLRWSTPMFTVALFSTRAGLFPWSPICYASALGLLWSKKARLLTIAFLAVFVVDLYIVAAAWVPAGGYGFGARRISDCAPLFGLGVALLYERVSQMRVRRLVAAFTAFCVLLCVVAMELQRAGRTRSSGGYARTFGQYLEEAGLPRWAQDAADAIGYPFVQPLGYLFAIYHHAKPDAFEGVVGNFMLDRDGQWFTVLSKKLELKRFNRAWVAEGLTLEDRPPATVTGPVRLLLSMFASESATVQIDGAVPGPVRVWWNEVERPARKTAMGWSFDVEAAQMRPGVNEVKLEAPIGAKIDALEFVPRGQWWK